MPMGRTGKTCVGRWQKDKTIVWRRALAKIYSGHTQFHCTVAFVRKKKKVANTIWS